MDYYATSMTVYELKNNGDNDTNNDNNNNNNDNIITMVIIITMGIIIYTNMEIYIKQKITSLCILFSFSCRLRRFGLTYIQIDVKYALLLLK